MRQIMKKRVAAALAAAMAVSMCTMFTGCDNTTSTTVNSTPFATLPTESTTASTDNSTTDATADTSTTDTTSGGTVTPPVTGDYINPLTGLPTENDLSNCRPLAIVVDNISAAHANQTGLDQADILYEALTAPGITRFLAVYADYTAVDEVCNIRSGRDYHFNWAEQHNAVLMCHGGSITDHYDFYQLAVDRLGSRWGFVDTQQEYFFNSIEAGVKYGTIDNFDERVDLKYDTLYNPDALNALLSSTSNKFVTLGGGTMEGTAKTVFNVTPYGQKKDMTGASVANTVNLKFSAQNTALSENVSFTYDAESGKYLRYQDGEKHVDAETGKQLAFTNVVTLITDVKCVETGIAQDPYMTLVETKNPNGLGYYFYDGKVIQINWYSTGNELILLDPNGDELTIAAGNTYIGYLDRSLIASGNPFWS